MCPVNSGTPKAPRPAHGPRRLGASTREVHTDGREGQVAAQSTDLARHGRQARETVRCGRPEGDCCSDHRSWGIMARRFALERGQRGYRVGAEARLDHTLDAHCVGQLGDARHASRTAYPPVIEVHDAVTGSLTPYRLAHPKQSRAPLSRQAAAREGALGSVPTSDLSSTRLRNCSALVGGRELLFRHVREAHGTLSLGSFNQLRFDHCIVRGRQLFLRELVALVPSKTA
jgi:hypothetical protein